MKAFIHRNFCVKGFFSETSILGTNFWPQNWLKGSISKGVRKVEEVRSPLFFNFRGGHPSSTFSKSHSLQRYVFLAVLEKVDLFCAKNTGF